jgi:hypothetical protein
MPDTSASNSNAKRKRDPEPSVPEFIYRFADYAASYLGASTTFSDNPAKSDRRQYLDELANERLFEYLDDGESKFAE